MLSKVAIIISPNWRDYAAKYLTDCLDSLARLDLSGIEAKLFLIDNESNDESYQLLQTLVGTSPVFAEVPAGKHAFPLRWEIVRHEDNAGFAKGNNKAMQLALDQGCEFLFLLNMDTLIEPACLQELIKVAISDDKIGAVQARLMCWPEQDKVNSLGNVTHFLGFGYCEGYGNQLTINNEQLTIKNICYPSGAAVLLRAAALKEVGLFDEEFWMYNEDQDLGWRLWLGGWRVVLAPAAVVYHKYEFSRSIKKFYWMDRNRLLAVLKNYDWLTLLVLAPAGLAMELSLFYSAWRGGWLRERRQVCAYFWRPSTWSYLRRARSQAQSLRQVKDSDIVKMFSGQILYQEIDSPAVRLGNMVFNIYWQIVKRIMFW